MGHKTLVGGTAYDIGAGKTLVGSTSYDIGIGKTTIGGVGYDVPFVQPHWEQIFNAAHYQLNDRDISENVLPNAQAFFLKRYTESGSGYGPNTQGGCFAYNTGSRWNWFSSSSNNFQQFVSYSSPTLVYHTTRDNLTYTAFYTNGWELVGKVTWASGTWTGNTDTSPKTISLPSGWFLVVTSVTSTYNIDNCAVNGYSNKYVIGGCMNMNGTFKYDQPNLSPLFDATDTSIKIRTNSRNNVTFKYWYCY